MEFWQLLCLSSISLLLLLILSEIKKILTEMTKVVALLVVINDVVTCQKTLLQIITDPHITFAEDELEEVRRSRYRRGIDMDENDNPEGKGWKGGKGGKGMFGKTK